MRISELLTVDQIRVPLAGIRALEVIDELCGLLLPELEESAHDQIVAEIRQLEREAPTGIGYGIAVPHAHTELAVEPKLAIGLGPEPLNFAAVDDVPVRLVFLVLCPANRPRRHLRLLARISRLMHDPGLRAGMMASRNAQELYTVLCAYEAEHFG